MLRVQFLSASDLPVVYYLRQFPGRRPVWGECEFRFENEKLIANAGSQPAVDFCVVYDDVREPVELRCPPGRRILVTAEPPEVRDYDPDFLAQFDTVVAVDRDIKHPNPVFSQQALSWMVGWKFFQEDQGEIKDYDFFKSHDFSKKPKLIGVVASKKSITKGHALRYKFALRLKEHFGDRMDMYGLGIQEIDDKWDALADYEYALSIENSVIPDYWTEKITDAYLTQSFPFYYGCPNLEDYFPAESFERIELKEPEAVIEQIERASEGNLREERLSSLLAARDLAMDRHNVFPMLARLIMGIRRDGPAPNSELPGTISIRPHSHFNRGLWKRLRRRIYG
ncbi:MAG: glycosyltransferase family 10 [Leptospirales bacterium]